MSDLGYCPDCRAPGVKQAIAGGSTKCLNGHWHATSRFTDKAGIAQREAGIEDYLVERVKATGGTVRKVGWIGHPGAPDRLCGWPSTGRHGLVELKRPGGDPEPHQAREHAKLRAIGFRVDVIDTREAIDAYVLEMAGQ